MLYSLNIDYFNSDFDLKCREKEISVCYTTKLFSNDII